MKKVASNEEDPTSQNLIKQLRGRKKLLSLGLNSSSSLPGSYYFLYEKRSEDYQLITFWVRGRLRNNSKQPSSVSRKCPSRRLINVLLRIHGGLFFPSAAFAPSSKQLSSKENALTCKWAENLFKQMHPSQRRVQENCTMATGSGVSLSSDLLHPRQGKTSAQFKLIHVFIIKPPSSMSSTIRPWITNAALKSADYTTETGRARNRRRSERHSRTGDDLEQVPWIRNQLCDSLPEENSRAIGYHDLGMLYNHTGVL